MKRYFYKTKDGQNFLNLKSSIKDNSNDYIPISEEEYNKQCTKLPEPSETQRQINEAKSYLEKTDYIVLKIAEAQADEDLELVGKLKHEYADKLLKRKECRELINTSLQ